MAKELDLSQKLLAAKKPRRQSWFDKMSKADQTALLKARANRGAIIIPMTLVYAKINEEIPLPVQYQDFCRWWRG